MYFYCLLFLLACIMSKMNMNNEENKSETKKGQHFQPTNISEINPATIRQNVPETETPVSNVVIYTSTRASEI